MFGRSKFDEIVEFVKFKTSNDKMRKFDDEESDEKHSRPKIEQSLRPDLCHCAATIRDEKRPCSCLERFLGRFILHIRANFDNFDDGGLSSKFGWFKS